MKMKKAALLIFIMLLALPGWSEIIAREGKGYLEMVNGQLILHLKGSYYELGYQHGKLLQDMVRKNISRIVDNQEEIGKEPKYIMYKMLRGGMHERLLPHIPEKYREEMRGLADGAGGDIRRCDCGKSVP
jgi:isopenicillin-N N-acyltransferase-like protein